MQLVNNESFNPFSVERSGEYQIQMSKIKQEDGTFIETHDKKCEFCRLWYALNQN